MTFRRLLAIAATVLVVILLAGCYPLHPERCNRMIIVIDGIEHMSCQSGLRPIGGTR